MLNEIIRGRGSIVVETFDYNYHEFELIEKDSKYYLKYQNDYKLITKLVIKPDLWVFYKKGGYEHGVNLLKPVSLARKKVLAWDFHIDPEIFDILIENKLITYSKAMADLYDLPVELSRDYFSHRRDYKHSKNKELVLERWKKGMFN